jgi:hypothetical protein
MIPPISHQGRYGLWIEVEMIANAEMKEAAN